MKKTMHYKGHRWTNDELVTLMKMWANDEMVSDIAAELKSTNVSILKQVQRLRANGIPLAKRSKGHEPGKSNHSWTQSDVEYLIRRRNERATSEQIAIELLRTPNAVDGMIQRLRKENITVAMRGNGVRRLWDVNILKAITTQSLAI